MQASLESLETRIPRNSHIESMLAKPAHFILVSKLVHFVQNCVYLTILVVSPYLIGWELTARFAEVGFKSFAEGPRHCKVFLLKRCEGFKGFRLCQSFRRFEGFKGFRPQVLEGFLKRCKCLLVTFDHKEEKQHDQTTRSTTVVMKFILVFVFVFSFYVLMLLAKDIPHQDDW